jgi:hypothetical protein
MISAYEFDENGKITRMEFVTFAEIMASEPVEHIDDVLSNLMNMKPEGGKH